ncbi:MAG: hypothetical protein IJU46_01840 [Clostridia bacterium]|nr:hypothetical protein [Clostridia bacterium]
METVEKIMISSDRLFALISPKGGELVSLKLREDRRGARELIWQGRSEGYDPDVSGQCWEGHSPNLFPVCGRLFGGVHQGSDGKEYGMPLHGFLQSLEPLGTGISGNSATFIFCSGPDTRKYYPYGFCLFLTHSVRENVYSLSVTVVNTGDEEMPFSWGGHPGFSLPLEDGLAFEDYCLELGEGSVPRRIGITPRGFRDGKTYPVDMEDGRILRLSHRLFDEEGIFLRGVGGSVTLRPYSGRGRTVTLRAPGCPVFGFWHDAGLPVPYVCIEPWHGSPDAEIPGCSLRTKDDMIKLAPGCCYTGGYEIEVGNV